MSNIDEKMQKLKILRELVLHKIYELSDGDCSRRIDFEDLFESLSQEGFGDREQFKSCINYLGSRRYINNEILSTPDGACSMYDSTAITSLGIDFLEREEQEDSSIFVAQPTYSFQGIKDANIVIGSRNIQHVNFETAELDKFLNLTEELISKLPDETTLTDIKKTILEQKEEGRPSKGFLRMLSNQLMAYVLKAGIEVAKYGLTNLF